MRGNRRLAASGRAFLVVGLICWSTPALGEFAAILGGPSYSPGLGGYVALKGVNILRSEGLWFSRADRYDALGNDLGLRSFGWAPAGDVTMELAHLGVDANGATDTGVNGIDGVGRLIGYAHKYDALGGDKGLRAVRWDASGAVATELQVLGQSVTGVSESYARDVNAQGMVIGYARKFSSTLQLLGDRAVRWDASGAIMELEALGTDPGGKTASETRAINAGGVIVGEAYKYDDMGVYRGLSAVRWDASGAATELGNLGADLTGTVRSEPNDINDAGTIVGLSMKPNAAGLQLGLRAVRWDPGSTVAVELGGLGTSPTGTANARATAINAAGVIIGGAQKYDALGNSQGYLAVRWNPMSTEAVELGVLGTDAAGSTWSIANAINIDGLVVGYVRKYDASGNDLGYVATLWGLDNRAVDLNTLIDPASGWTLTSAQTITDDGWIAGVGTYDPDGLGGQDAYTRMWVMELAAIPEPAGLAWLLIGVAATMARRRAAC